MGLGLLGLATNTCKNHKVKNLASEKMYCQSKHDGLRGLSSRHDKQNVIYLENMKSFKLNVTRLLF